ncbi:hypothetical protein NL676_014690 [Syzygium grande]|nr:hypothetical protein NL676_014690 [Syzygium grande]
MTKRYSILKTFEVNGMAVVVEEIVAVGKAAVKKGIIRRRGNQTNRIGVEEDAVVEEAAVRDKKWQTAMDEEIKAIDRNNTCELAELPKGTQPIGVKWVFKRKMNAQGEIERICPKEPLSPDVFSHFGGRPVGFGHRHDGPKICEPLSQGRGTRETALGRSPDGDQRRAPGAGHGGTSSAGAAGSAAVEGNGFRRGAWKPLVGS